MKKKYIILIYIVLVIFNTYAQVPDNLGYWRSRIAQGLATANPNVIPPAAINLGSNLTTNLVLSGNSPDVLISNEAGNTESENSIFMNPVNGSFILNSENSFTNSPFNIGISRFESNNNGTTWNGSTFLNANGDNGDPATGVNRNLRRFIGYINLTGGQSVAYSDNGTTWTNSLVANAACSFNCILDKNHLWVDNALSSPNVGNIYTAWTNFTETTSLVSFSRSTNAGVNWSTPINISTAPGQGVNLQTGPNGNVYAVWANGAPETSIRFVRSTNAGVSFSSETAIINNIAGIRFQPGFVTTDFVGKGVRTNSFPSMAVDVSGGARNGNIYVVWANRGVPGVNTGNDIDIYMIRSTDTGTTWSVPIKVNQDASGQGRRHWLPWITCDPVTGALHTIFYDDRNTTATNAETWVASSFDGGATWTDCRVSDVSFTPTPIPNLAQGYFGDYIGITAFNNNVYPVWTDNRNGRAQSFVSPFVVVPPACVNGIVLQNRTAIIGQTELFRSSSTITVAGGGTTVQLNGNGTQGANWTLRAQSRITMGVSMRVQTGASLRANIVNCVAGTRNSAEQQVFSNNGEGIEQEIANQLKIYPNPSNDGVFQVALESSESVGGELKVVDLMGNVLFEKDFKTSDKASVDISKQNGGVYIVQFATKEYLITKKIIYGK